MYKFSAPMPYDITNIDKLTNLNKIIEKSKITSLFLSLPSSCEFFTGFEQYRNGLQDKNFDYFKELISYSLNKNFDVIYLLNSPKHLDLEAIDFKQKLEKLDRLLNELKKLGVNKLRIAEHKLMSYISQHYSYFSIYASTSFEFKTIAEYQNFMFMHPNVKQIVPSSDSIKNFDFLKNLKKLLPNTEIEIMVNEGCRNGCPNRFGHSSDRIDKFINILDDISMSNTYYTRTFCRNIEKQNPFLALVRANVVYPWEIKEYENIGITNFKLVGRDPFFHIDNNHFHEYCSYLKNIDNVQNSDNISVNTFIHHLIGDYILSALMVKDYKKYLPNINHFKKYGHLCASRCGVECRYCYKCAEKIQKVFEKKMKEKDKQPHYVPACKMA